MSINTVSTLSFRRLLHEIRDNQPDVSVRLRHLGKMWMTNFSVLVKVTDKGAIFADRATGEFTYVADLNSIVQFEIDSRFREYHPHFHYELIPDELGREAEGST
jgi:hypothetical protein